MSIDDAPLDCKDIKNSAAIFAIDLQTQNGKDHASRLSDYQSN